MAVAHRLDHIAPFHVMAILEKAKALEAAGRAQALKTTGGGGEPKEPA